MFPVDRLLQEPYDNQIEVVRERDSGSFFMLGALAPYAASAATTPSLGAAATYGVLSGTYVNTVPGTTVNGDVGFTTSPAVVPGGTHANFGSGAPYATAGSDQGTLLSALAVQPCTFTFAPGAIDLATDITHGPIGVYTPGVYCTGAASAASIGTAGMTLNGAGTYIFRIDGAFTSVANSVVTLSGASACDVFWTPTSAATLGANSTMVGSIVAAAGVTLGNTVTMNGRALAFGGTVTTVLNDTITAPTCAAPVYEGSRRGTINVVKRVINDNGRTKQISDFALFVNGSPVASGITNNFQAPADAYVITETNDPNYTRTFSGDCDINGKVALNPGDNRFCIITNDDIGAPVVVAPVAPLIDVVKVPSPLALPSGPGSVTYTYTLRNIGTVPVTDITMVGDTCAPIQLVSGDTNNNGKLEVNETWVHRCTTNLTQTHTNTVVATGWANGLTATDIASATVIVGLPFVPPLIHVTKVPSVFALPVGGGAVTYTKKVTNPGTIPLSNVRLADDKCTAVKFVSGDANLDSKLDVNETWTYTCLANLKQTTTNTVIASGDANGFTARDFAIATVVVATAAPMLPKTGSPSDLSGVVAAAALVLLGAMSLYAIRKARNA